MASTDSLSSVKADMRAKAKLARKHAAQSHGMRAAEALRAQGLAFAGVSPTAIVSGYFAIGDEANITPLMQRLYEEGHRIALPVIIAKARPLEFRAYAPGDPLQNGQWGIQEPAQSAEVVVPDVILAPLLAYDNEGYRLGYGGGFYDRSLEALKAQKPVLSIGVAYDEQKVDAVPRDAYDQRLDWILTPSGVKQFSA